MRSGCAPLGYVLSHKQRKQLAADVLQALRSVRGRKRISCKCSRATEERSGVGVGNS